MVSLAGRQLVGGRGSGRGVELDIFAGSQLWLRSLLCTHPSRQDAKIQYNMAMQSNMEALVAVNNSLAKIKKSAETKDVAAIKMAMETYRPKDFGLTGQTRSNKEVPLIQARRTCAFHVLRSRQARVGVCATRGITFGRVAPRHPSITSGGRSSVHAAAGEGGALLAG